MVTVEEGSGVGFLVRNGGNCYVILPTHLHGRRRDGIRIGSERSGGAIGTADVVYVVPGDADISLGLVRGGIASDCGDDWGRLPRNLNSRLAPGTEMMLRRPRQSVNEGRRVLIHSGGFRLVTLVPAQGEQADLFGGTSGAVAFQGDLPIAMVLRAADAGQVLAMRMDEIVAQLARYIGTPAQRAAPEPPAPETGGTPATLPPGDPLEAVDWSPHPIDGAVDPTAMLAGAGPWIFPLDGGKARVVLRLRDTDRLSRIRLRALTGTDAHIPRGITVFTDNSSDPARPRPSEIPAPEMAPDGLFDLRFGERFAHSVTIEIHSSWGNGSPVRLDTISID